MTDILHPRAKDDAHAPLPAVDQPEERRAPLWFSLIAYLLLLAVLLGGIYLGVLALMTPAILPAVRLLTQHG